MLRDYRAALTNLCCALAPALALGACSTDEPDAPAPAENGLASSAPASDEGGSDWRLVWADEFESDAIDPDKWAFDRDCWGGGNSERQCYTDRPENARVEDGRLLITARLEEMTGPALPAHMRDADRPPETRTQPFSSARLVTRGKAAWTYGRIEVRAELPRGQGIWPAIWMLPEESVYGGWAASGEIDIMEVVNLGAPCEACASGIEDRVLGTLHYGGRAPENVYSGTAATLPDLGRGAHTFSIDWSPQAIIWSLNGEPYACQSPQTWYSTSDAAEGRHAAPFDQPFHLILNVAVGGDWPENVNLGGVDRDVLPQTMSVDFVRVYKWAGAGEAPAPDGACEPEFYSGAARTGE